MTHTARDLLCRGDLDGFGNMLHESWQLKKSLASKISNNCVARFRQTIEQR